MTVGAFTLVDAGLLAQQRGEIIPHSDTINAVLIDDAHTPAPATEATFADISANENADTDYTTNHAEGLTVTITTTEAAGVVKVDMALADFGTPRTIQTRYFYLIRLANGTTKQSTDLILGYMDLRTENDGDTGSTASDFTVDANVANGLYTYDEAP